MRLTDIEADCYRRLGFGVTPATEVTTRIRAFVNETHREILRIKNFRRFRRRLVTGACIANVPFMALPQAAVRIFNISDRTNGRLLDEKDLLWLRRSDPGLTATTANPWAFAIYNLASPVIRQPSAAAQLFVISTAAGDGAGVTAYLESLRTGAYFDADSKPMNGVTGVGFTRTDTIDVGKFYLSAAATGTVTLREGSGVGTVLSTIPIGKSFARYSLVHLYPTPSAAVTYYIDIECHVEDMANAFDEPLLPEEFHHLLALGARKKEYEKREKWDAVGKTNDEFIREVSKLKTWVNQLQGTENNGDRFSQLGAWYPPGT